MINISGKSICQSCFAEIFSEPCPRCGFSEASYVPEFAVLPCGSVLQGRYAVGRVIGKGGFGITYLAYDIKLDRKIAIKEYFPRDLAWRSSDTATVTTHSGDDSDTFKSGAEKFYDEARLVARFNGSSSIVNVFDFFYENSTVYYSMEYLRGQTVNDCVSKNGAMTAEQVRYIAKEVAEALAATHGANVLHRDVSPDNIMICSDGKIKLIDFGAARRVISEMSQNFSVILKQGFAPLEQYRKNGNQGPWTDIYSLGTTLYYCLTGKIPDDPMSRIENDEEFISSLMSVDENLRNIIIKAAALKIQDRYGSAEELLNDLKNGFTVSAQDTEIHQSIAASPQNTNRTSEPRHYSAKPAAETVPEPEVNVYGETAAVNKNKPLIIAAVIGAIIVVLVVFLIVSLVNGGNNDTVTADAETQSETTTVKATTTTTTSNDISEKQQTQSETTTAKATTTAPNDISEKQQTQSKTTTAKANKTAPNDIPEKQQTQSETTTAKANKTAPNDIPEEQQEQKNANAKNVHTATTAFVATAYVDDCEYKIPTGGVISSGGPTASKNGKTLDLTVGLGKDFKGYFYVNIDEKSYFVLRALWSDEPISDECVNIANERDLTEEEALKFGVGCFPSAK